MSKAYSEIDFSTQVTQDRTWRLKEISDLKGAVEKADQSLQKVLLRALVTICYAHWEGYVRFAARRYLEHISLRRLQFSELDIQFRINHFLPRLAALATAKTSIQERANLVSAILDSKTQRFSRANDELVDTKSNLNAKILSEICLVCSLPEEPFTEKSTFIDVVLLKRRNSIAHGEETFIEIGDLEELTAGTIELMRMFGDALENRVVLRGYRAA
jgi:hypothetical protein